MTLTSIARDAVSLVGLVGVMIYQDPVLSLSSLLIGPPLIYTVDLPDAPGAAHHP